MRERRRLLIAAGIGALTPGFARARAVKPPARSGAFTVGLLWGDGPEHSARSPAFATFKIALAGHGYVEGQNLSFEPRFAEGRYERLPALAAGLVQKKVDVLVSIGSPMTRAAHAATARIPIIAVNVTTPVVHGFAVSLARPGKNVTGITNSSADTGIKRLQNLARLAPRARRIGFILNPDNRVHMEADVEGLAARLSLEAVRVLIRNADDCERELAACKGRVDTLSVAQDYAFNPLLARFARFALDERLPSTSQQRAFVESGGLSSYGQDANEQWRIAGEYAARILSGANPGDLPFVEASQFEFCINRRTASALGIAIPPDMLLDAQMI